MRITSEIRQRPDKKILGLLCGIPPDNRRERDTWHRVCRGYALGIWGDRKESGYTEGEAEWLQGGEGNL